ncbi:TPA: YopX family protein [Streptococcus suis]
MIQRYRAWDKTRNEWSNGFFIYSEGGLYTPDYGFNRKHFKKRTNVYPIVKQERFILMQSTGLFDTFRQNELFEDDVILWTYFDEWEDSGEARIVYRDGCWKIVDVKTGKEVWDTLFDCLENCDVYLAGNIYENPKLKEATND